MRVIVSLVLVCLARIAPAHEFWIEAEEYQVASGGDVVARLYNGQEFSGVEMAWFDGRVAAARWSTAAESGTFEGRAGDRPALRIAPAPQGLVQLVYQSTPTALTYDKMEKFARFAETSGNGWAVQRHRARGLRENGIRETYVRYCKALVAVGDGAGADRPAGLRHEIVALEAPGGDLARGLRVELRFEGAVLAEAQLDMFEKSADGAVTKASFQSDANGQVVVPVRAGYRYLLNSVVLLEAEARGVDWESHWASLTFEIGK